VVNYNILLNCYQLAAVKKLDDRADFSPTPAILHRNYPHGWLLQTQAAGSP